MTGIRLYVGEEIINAEENKEIRSACFMLHTIGATFGAFVFGHNY